MQNFLATHRDEIIARTRAKVAGRDAPRATTIEIDEGIPLFLDQLIATLRSPSPSDDAEISRVATQHGSNLLRRGVTVGQVVHDYGDVCQSVTDLAVATKAPISSEDFRTLNRCLDDAIAGAVSEYAHEQDVSRHGASQQLQRLTDTAITAFEVLRAGRVGVGGSTGTVVLHSLLAIRAALVDRPPSEEPKQQREVPADAA